MLDFLREAPLYSRHLTGQKAPGDVADMRGHAYYYFRCGMKELR